VVRPDEGAGPSGPSDDVVGSVLVEDLGSRIVVVGADEGPGGGAAGRAGLGGGVRVEVVPLATVDAVSGPVSSTAVRVLVRDGEVERAAAMLGRPHELRGVVEHGDARGRTIGFPTANVTVSGDMLLPRDGVYAGLYVGPDGVPRPAAVNVGRRPTFYDESGLLLVEAHLIDFDGDLYGQRAGVRFVRRLRDEQRFAGIDALVAQLRRDVDAARAAVA
jgi:riboflavin kinase/FMN adenylyltransferase